MPEDGMRLTMARVEVVSTARWQGQGGRSVLLSDDVRSETRSVVRIDRPTATFHTSDRPSRAVDHLQQQFLIYRRGRFCRRICIAQTQSRENVFLRPAVMAQAQLYEVDFTRSGIDHQLGIDDPSEVRKVWFMVESSPTDPRLQITLQAVLSN